ncbi:hypothetical protein SLA2020_234640 [Shorea laevis]
MESLLKGRNLLQHGLRCNIGLGEVVNVWSDAWVPTLLSFRIMSPAPPNKENLKVSNLVSAHGTWDTRKLNALFQPYEVNEILKIPLAASCATIVWHYTKSGDFSIKTAYFVVASLLMATQTSASKPLAFWKSIWKLRVPPKVQLFIWRICHNALPSQVNLYHRGVVESPLCSNCKANDENIPHLLFFALMQKPPGLFLI